MSFSDEVIQKVWEKGTIVPDYNPDKYRRDECKAWIGRDDYGIRASELGLGWEINYINPDGGDDISNMRPLQWKNNVAKQDDPLKCVVTSYDIENIYLK